MAPKFTLQPVLDYRHSRVEALEVELGNLIASRQRGAAFLEKLQQTQQGLFGELGDQQSGDLDLWTVNQVRSNLRTIEERIRQQQLALLELEQQVKEKRSEMVGAKQDEETLVTLKNKEIERYQAEQVRQERSLVDDIYISQAYRRMGETTNKL